MRGWSVFVLIAAACGPTRHPGPSEAQPRLSAALLAGTWRADDGSELIFDGAQRARWLYANEMGLDTFPLWYRVGESERPVQIDFPVDSVAAARPHGAALHCIAELIAVDALRIDCERGGARPQATYRPTEFGSEALVFRRVP